MRLVYAVVVFLCLTVSSAVADEGMWTFDNFPAAKVASAYGFTPSAAFLEHLCKASVRIAGGCSASFISPQGLVMTNYHCIVECVGRLSSAERDYVSSGFYAKLQSDDKACPDFELDRLTSIENVSTAIAGATAGKTGEAAQKALHAAEAVAQQSCGRYPTVRCDVV